MTLLNLTKPVDQATASAVCLACNAWFFSEKDNIDEARSEVAELLRRHARLHLDASGILRLIE
jgi:hypothetical protein